MDEEIETLAHDRYKPVARLSGVADGLPALGIVAAVLGIIHAMGALDQSPEALGGLIGAALVGTFCRHISLLRDRRADRAEDQSGAAEAAQAVHARQAEPARLHERGDAAGRGRVRAQNDPRPRSGRRSTWSKARRLPAAPPPPATMSSRKPHERRPASLTTSTLQRRSSTARCSNIRASRSSACRASPQALDQFVAEAPRRLDASVRRHAGHGDDRDGPGNDAHSGDRRLRRPAAPRSTRATSRRRAFSSRSTSGSTISSLRPIFGESPPIGPSAIRRRSAAARTAIETALVEEFARALGRALEAAFAPLALALARLRTPR